MIGEWRTFLGTQGALPGPDGGLVFPPGRTDAACHLFDLSHLGLIAVTGEDAHAFLQGQLTNDIRELSDAHSHLSGWCSPKGRMLACFRLIRLDGEILLQLPLASLEAALQRMRRYVLRARVSLHDASARIMRMGVAGPAAADLLENRLGRLPEFDSGVRRYQALTLLRLPGAGTPRFQVLGPGQALADLWSWLAAQGAAPDNEDAWSLLDIRAGLPSVLPGTEDAFVPQMTNMQLVDGLSFTKGCYTGQEVVARMQYLGRLKRRMYRARVTSPRRPNPGDELFAPSSASGQGAGRVVDARPVGPDRYELLVVVELAALEQGEVRLEEGAPPLEFLTLPYPFAPTQTRVH